METIKSKQEFESVFSGGKRANDRLVRITVLENDEGGPDKVAFVAAKRLGNAVYRNRCKRVLREAARQCGMPWDKKKVIIFATRHTHDSNPAQVAAALTALRQRFGA